MTEESSSVSHLSGATTTVDVDNTKTQTTGGNGVMSSSSNDLELFYSQVAVVVIAVVGTAGNSLVLYAVYASKQYKKLMLIVNQNALDLFSSLSLFFIYCLKLCNIYLSGALGDWLCTLLFSENLIWCGTNGSVINLAAITVDRYLKVVHPIWSRKWLSPWVIYSEMTFSWVAGIVSNTILVFVTSVVIDGVCYGYEDFGGAFQFRAYFVWYIASFYVVILFIFIFCYWRILVAVRRKASTMATHRAAGSSTAQTQSAQVQSNIIKTMIFVSAFYAISWGPANVYYIFSMVNYPDSHTIIGSRYYTTLFIGFLYTCANPFIYATKFNPVRKVIKDMIPCIH